MPLNPLKRPDNFFGLVLALELGSFVRLLPVATNACPLNDG